MDQQINQAIELNPHQYEKNDVAQTLDRYAEAVRNGNPRSIMSHYAEEIRAFDMMPPLEFNGKSDYQTRSWEKCFSNVFKFPINYTYIKPKIEMSGNLAIVHSLVHMSGDMTTGENVDNWLRATTVFKKSGSQWLIIHDHMSVPIDENMHALMNMAPDDIPEGQYH